MLIFSVGCFTCLLKMCLAETPGRHGEASIEQLAIDYDDLQDLDLAFSYMRHSVDCDEIDCDDLRDLDLLSGYLRLSAPWRRSCRASRPPQRCR